MAFSTEAADDEFVDEIYDDDFEEDIIVFDENRERVIKAYEHVYNLKPGTKVFIRATGEGPYLIEKAEGGKYTLCDEKCNSAKEGQAFKEDELEVKQNEQST